MAPGRARRASVAPASSGTAPMALALSGAVPTALARAHRGIVCFDIDGTLVPCTSSGGFLAARLGHLDALAEAEWRYEDGLIDNAEVCRIDALGWAGRSVAEVDGWLGELPLVTGIAETTAWCRANGLVPILASLAWSVVGRNLAGRFGFAAWSGPELEQVGAVFTGSVARSFDEYAKRDDALACGRSLGVPADRCIAVGDSRSDLPLFAACGLSIAFNGTPAARAAASAQVDGDDLSLLIPLVQEWTADWL